MIWLPLVVSLVGAVMTTGGVLAVRRHDRWVRAHYPLFVAFAAGVLIAMSFLHLLPAALTAAPRASFGTLAGFFFLHLVDRLSGVGPVEAGAASPAKVLVPVIGIGLHSFLDGFSLAAGFRFDEATGMMMALGMVLHEFPEGAITYGILRGSGFSDRQCLLLALLVAAATTPAGTAISLPVVAHLPLDLLGLLLAVSTGALLYLGAAHLLPQVSGVRPLIGLVMGIVLATVIALSSA